MANLANGVLDAALNYIATNGVEAEIQDSSSTALVDSVTLDSGNYGTVADNTGAGGGRSIECLVSDASDMDGIAVTANGTATKGVIKNAGGDVLVSADLSASVALTTADQVNIGTITVILEDPA